MLKRHQGALFLVTCLILTTVPTALGAPSTQAVAVAADGSGDYNFNGENDHVQINQALETEEMKIENLTLINNQTATNYTIQIDCAEPGTTPENTAVGNDQINPDEIVQNDTGVTETVPEQCLETENEASSVIDNRLREASPNTVFKDKSYLDIGDRPGIGKYRELIQFDLSEYSDAENISSATLSLYWFYPDGKERPKDTIIEVYRPAAAWNPENVTWNSKDNGVLWIQPGGDCRSKKEKRGKRNFRMCCSNTRTGYPPIPTPWWD
jgi:hypothetical protein